MEAERRKGKRKTDWKIGRREKNERREDEDEELDKSDRWKFFFNSFSFALPL